MQIRLRLFYAALRKRPHAELKRRAVTKTIIKGKPWLNPHSEEDTKQYQALYPSGYSDIGLSSSSG